MEPELTVNEVPISELHPYEGNAKKHDDAQVETIVASIKEFGNCDPIAVWHRPDGEMEIIEGHGRLLALQRLGVKTAPVIYLDHLTDEQRRAYTHVHNQTTLSTGFDTELLDRDIEQLDFDWDSFGFDVDLIDESELDNFFSASENNSTSQERTATCPECGCVFAV